MTFSHNLVAAAPGLILLTWGLLSAILLWDFKKVLQEKEAPYETAG